MPFTTVAAGAPGVFVDSESALADAYATLSTTPGGGTIYLTRGFSREDGVYLSGGGSNPVHITSANPNDPVDISRIYLNDVDNLRVSDVAVDSTGMFVSQFEGDVDINGSSAIELSNIVFTSDGTMLFDPRLASTVDGGRLGVITDSSDIVISDTVGSNYFNGWMLLESRDITLRDNELFEIQGDGIKMREVQDVLIEDNYLHDFAFSPNEVNHSDFIQLQASGATTTSSDITITGNVLETGNGSSVQGIWIGAAARPHENITITDNLIYTASANGIGVNDARGVEITGNTLLWNPEAETIKADGNTSFEPSIRASGNVRDLTIEDNITPRFALDVPASMSGNIDISYRPGDENYVGDHFVNAANGGDIGPNGWQLRSGSEFVGTGASASQPGGASAGAQNAPAPQQPAPEPQPEPVEEAQDAPQQPDEPTAPAAPQPAPVTGAQASTLFAADFENGVEDLSDFDSDLVRAFDRNIVDTPDGSGFRIGSGRMVRLDVDNEQIHNLDSFGLEMEITLLGSDDVGRFLHFPRTFEASVDRDGTVTFELRTDEGVFQVNSGDVVLNDGDTHLFAVGYDDAAGTLSMSIDGTVVGTTDASGSTNDASFHGLTIGSIWGDSVNAVVDDIFLGTDPMEAGVDLSLDVGETFDPAPDAPVGGLAGGGSGGHGGGVHQTDNEADVPDGTDFFTTLLDIDFEAGLRDASDFDSEFRDGDARDITATGRGDNAYQISDDDFFRLERDNDQIHELESFGLSLDIQLLDATDTGRFIHFPRAFEAVIEDDRSVSFRLDTNEGSFRVNSGDTTLDDLREHTFSIGYDGDAGQLTMAIDGDVVDSVAASGETAPMTFHGMAVGTIWGDGVTALVDNVWLGEPAPDSDVSPDAGLLHALISSAVDADPDEDRNVDDDDEALAA